MQSVVRRPLLGFALGIATAGLVFASGIAYAAATADEIKACTQKGNGTLYLSAGKGCKPGDSAVSWNVQGPPGPQGAAGQQGAGGPSGPQGPSGPAGTFGGSFQSPNGSYSISVADTGIELKGPGGSVKINGGNVILQGTVGLQLNAPILSMNGGCTRVMRQLNGGVTPSSAVYTC